METLSANVQKLISEHQKGFRDALRVLRTSDEPQTVEGTTKVVIAPVHPSKEATEDKK